MLRLLKNRIDGIYIVLFALFCLLAVSVAGLLTSDTAEAQIRPSGECRAAIVIDRSTSVKPHLAMMKRNVTRLFEPMGIHNPRIKLGFWTFANLPGNENYNAPFHDYVPSDREDTGFSTQFESIDVSTSGTNLEHSLGYHRGVQNQFIANIANRADLIVLITDAEDFSTNMYRAQDASRKYRAQGVQVIGGLVKNKSSSIMNRIINDSATKKDNIFQVSENYSNLSEVLQKWVVDKCYPKIYCEWNNTIFADDPRCEPPAAKPYSLSPSVTLTGSGVLFGSGSTSFSYDVTNSSTEAASRPTNWSVKRLVVDRGQPINALSFDEGEAYRDEYSCEKLVGLVRGKATCGNVEGASGTKVFGVGKTPMSVAEMGAATNAAVDDSWQVGTKLCYVLTLEKPTQLDEPTDRYSKAACVVVGKQPTFQVHGGDVVVGRNFESGGAGAANVVGNVTTKTGSINKTFGSWAEYGIFAPGVVRGVASAAGFEGGVPGISPPDQYEWSKLTFANRANDYGHFADEGGMGTTTNMVKYFIDGRRPVRQLTGDEPISFSGNDVVSGLYAKENGDLKVEGSTLNKGKMVIIYVPNGTATIDGNINYADERYGSIEEIPQMVIIAKNITINRNVTNVDAWLLAQDADGNGGKITTCDYTGNLTSEVCNTTLRINGPVLAKDMELRRTAGAGAGAASGQPAEVFNLRADMYLWGYNEGRSALRAETTHTIELPPHF